MLLFPFTFLFAIIPLCTITAAPTTLNTIKAPSIVLPSTSLTANSTTRSTALNTIKAPSFTTSASSSATSIPSTRLNTIQAPSLTTSSCSATSTSSPTASAGCLLNLPGGIISGLSTTGGACRYTIQYGQADRWDIPIASGDNMKHNTTTLPPACPQAENPSMLSSANGQDEQCLYAVVYTPKGLKKGDKVPIFVWVHGGSFYAGSASAPGLDGSPLALEGDMIVVIVQYRLGILGLLPPSSSPSSSDPTLALQDIILGLTQVQSYADMLGGDKTKVTIGGQSAGASLVKALLASPSAKGLFRAAVLQSDPMTYGTSSASVTTELQQLYYSQARMTSCGDLACLKQIPLDEILKSQGNLIASAPSQIQGIPLVTPLRPTHNTPTLPNEPTSQTFSSANSLSSPPKSIPLLITTTANEAGSVTGSLFPSPIPASNSTYSAILSLFVGPERASFIVNSPEYALTGQKGEDEFRVTFERLVTDGVWRCGSRAYADRWAEAGGNIWVGEWMKGVGYVSNEGSDYCGQQGRVCHEDDIFPAFQTSPSLSRISSTLQDEVLTRWISFIHNLDPNSVPSILSNSNIAIQILPGGIGSDRGLASPNIASVTSLRTIREPIQSNAPAPAVKWEKYRGEVAQVYAIGGGKVNVCPGGYWGQKVKFDWQIYQ